MPRSPDGSELEVFADALVKWYQEHQRTLPWRDRPTPYGVWVSEVMLQQTRVEVVRDYYARWMKRFPSLADLAQAEESEVLHLWQGLGYYSRARRLVEGARFVCEEFKGELPAEPEQLLRVPGVGPYSAGAISSIAYGRPSAIVDGNVVRVLSRYWALGGDPNKTPLKKQLWERARRLVVLQPPAMINQALMEFGATVCTPKRPLCATCVVQAGCAAFDSGRVDVLPELPKRKTKTKVRLVVLVLRRTPRALQPRLEEHSSEYGFITLPRDARWWAGLQAFPFCAAESDADPARVALRLAEQYAPSLPTSARVLEAVRHAVTRFDVELVPVVVSVLARVALGGAARWAGSTEIARMALPSAHRKVLQRVESDLQADDLTSSAARSTAARSTTRRKKRG